MGGPVLAPKKINLMTFAMDSLNSGSTKKKLYGVQMMSSLLKKEHLSTKTIAKLTSSTKTVASLFNMLGWTCDGDAVVRLFAAKVTAEIAGSLRAAAIPGAIQMVASLLDIDHQLKIRDHVLFIHNQEAKDLQNNHVGMEEKNSPLLNYWKQMVINCLIPVDEPYNKDELNLRIVRYWKRITRFWSIPEEEPSTDQDFLPVQGLLILERLANFDTGNCVEISRATGLISKMIDFTSYRNYMASINEAHQTMLAGLSLRVLRTLAGTKGKLGITLRQQILEYPLLLSNLAEILDDNGSSYDLRELAAEIITNLAIDRNTSEDIGHFRVVMNGLMHAFLRQDSDHLLREIAGQALAMLAMDSANNCLIMLMEPGMFSRDNRLDYQMFFRTRGAFRPAAGWNGLIVVACISNAILCTLFWSDFAYFYSSPFPYATVVLLLEVVQFLCSAASRLLTCNPIRRAISLWSPMVAILSLGPIAIGVYIDPDVNIPKNTMAKWLIAYAVLLIVVLLLTISRFRYPSIVRLLNVTLGSKQEFWCQVTLRLCIIASIMMPVLMSKDPRDRWLVIILEAIALALVLVSFGNLQIPAVTVRVVLALFHFLPNYFSYEEPIDENNNKDETNLDASLNIFYGMVIGQGILYIIACIFEFFSFIPRRSLIRHGGFGGQWGVELTTMIHDDKYKYTSASILGSMCEHARSELSNSDLKELSYTLREVLKGIIDAEGAELEVLIRLSSEIFIIIPDDFARELEHSQIKRKIVQRFVSALNSHRRPSADCPGIRRVIVQHAIYLMEFDSLYANDFQNCSMVEALSVVEKTSSRLENYRLFSGDVGLMEQSTPLSTLVARAKELMGSQGGDRQRQQVAAVPEKWLNGFVRAVALTERTGNALGTLAFTWATVVLLGGYPTVLSPETDFYYVTLIIFIEAARMFSRNNRLDYQLFFRTRGAFRPSAGWNELTVAACISNALMCKFLWGGIPFNLGPFPLVIVILLLVAIVQFIRSAASRIFTSYRIRNAISLWSPMVAILLLGAFILGFYVNPELTELKIDKKPYVKWIVAYVVLLILVLLLTISRFQFPSITKLLNSTLGRKQAFWFQLTLKLCIIASMMIPVFMFDGSNRSIVIMLEVVPLVQVSFGNLQTPVAAARVALALSRFIPENYNGEIKDGKGKDFSRINLPESLNIFYGMVLGQGILYIAACIFEVFSFIPRRSLIRHGGLGGQWGVASVNLYYSYAFEKYMEGGVLAPKKISLITFAMDSLSSDSPKMQLYGVQMLHIFQQRESTRERLIAKLTTSTKTMARLISMLGWTSASHKVVRLYAAKATVELAKSLRVVTVPGTVQLVSSLLDTDFKQKGGNPLLEAAGSHEAKQDPVSIATDGQEEMQEDTIRDAADNQYHIQERHEDTNNLLGTQTQPTQINGYVSFMLRSWQRISEYWSIPKEQPLTEHDILPALGMSIVDNLASGDKDNCVEIHRASNLILKIIRFTSFRNVTATGEAQQMVLVMSSLKVLQRLTSIGGEIGISLRNKISKNPFLLRNLTDILGDNTSNQELSKLVAGILRNLPLMGTQGRRLGKCR
uniref:Uncharacterized protein n=1 Tax=Leersia perrieri TaxID=77586 RepID=A0A0D9X298_9ORYZ